MALSNTCLSPGTKGRNDWDVYFREKYSLILGTEGHHFQPIGLPYLSVLEKQASSDTG